MYRGGLGRTAWNRTASRVARRPVRRPQSTKAARHAGVGRAPPAGNAQTPTWRESAPYAPDTLARKTEGYTGADIKEVAQLGLKLAFHAGAELANDHLLAAIPEIRPLSKTDPESVTEVTKWLDNHTKPAGNGHDASHPLNGNALKRHVTA